jgi:hypothetical protein
MKLSEFKSKLNVLDAVRFLQPDGSAVPSHFHITEVGLTTKYFIDCGGTVREEKAVNFQLWEANDLDHRLSTEKLLKIIALSEMKLGISDMEIEVEYQKETIGRYGVDFKDKTFILTAKHTNCLASDNCGIPAGKQKMEMSEPDAKFCCTPGSGCC